ncbi:SCO6880 family protein [Propioniciclava soli]|uniref:SCO6880 family protein n=1 Tax=Propioniciclava soli TaxID=2775081 RepID=UPI001E4DC38B|nr:SCO6880 family protein [Propioniciclava soli]
MTIYNDYARDKAGLFFGLSGAQLGTLVVGAFPALIALSSSRWLVTVGLVIGWVVLALLTVLPIHGRPAVGWAAAAARFVTGRVTGWSVWRSKLTRGAVTDVAAADLPGVMNALDIHEGTPRPPLMQRVAIIQDHVARTWAVTAKITHQGIMTATEAERAQMARGLSDLLDICSRGELVAELLFVVRTVPDDGAERAQWVARHRVREGTGAAQINDQLAAALTRASVRTEAFVTLVVPEGRIARRAREVGGRVEGRARVLELTMAEVEAQLVGALGFTEVVWLTSPELAVAVRTGFAPTDRAGIVAALAEREQDPTVNAGVPWSQAGPSGADTMARWYSHDAWNSASVGIALPPRGVLMGAMAPMLTPSEAMERRTMVVAYPIKTLRAAERETGKGEWAADVGEAMREGAKMKTRAKEATTIRHRRALDAKLAAGNSLTTPYAVCTVTVPKHFSIGDYSHQLEAAVRRAGFAPQVLDLAHDVAFAASSLPLGISLSRSTT